MSAAEVGQLARRLTCGLYVHDAAMGLIRDNRSLSLAPPSHAPGGPPEGLIKRKDGTSLAYDGVHHVEAARTDLVLAEELDRAFLVSALIMLGDRLAAEDYFDQAPILEMVRHLRNAAGHGNVFGIRDPEEPADTDRGPSPRPAGLAAIEVYAHLVGGDQRSAYREILQFAAELHRADPVLAAAMTVIRPSTTGDRRYDALLAAVVDLTLTQGGLPRPEWLDDPR